MGMEEEKVNRISGVIIAAARLKVVTGVGLILSVTSMSGCVNSPITPLVMTERKVFDLPTPNTEITINLGDTLVSKGVRTTGKALEVFRATKFGKKPGEASYGTCAVSVNPSSQFLKGRWQTDQETAECFGPFNMQITLSDGNTNWNCPGQYVTGDVCRDDLSGGFFLAFHDTQVSTLRLEQDFANLAVVEKVVSSQTNFVQQLIYNGRSGDTLKFIYRELSDDMLRAAFSQEVQYDLSQSTEIGFKGVRIEVIEASNTSITYKVLSNF